MGCYWLADALEDVGNIVEAEAKELAKQRMKTTNLGGQPPQVRS